MTKEKMQNLASPKPLEKTYSDINLEKWSLFTTKNRQGQRVLERMAKLPDGTKVIQRVIVGQKGATETLTAAEAKIFYLLLDLWHNQGRNPNGVVYTSLHRLFNTLIRAEKLPRSGKTRRGNWSKAWLKSKVGRLIGVPLIYENSYQGKDGAIDNTVPFTLLEGSTIFERKSINPRQKFFDFSHFTLHRVILKSLLEKNVKPVRADVILGFRKEISLILYRILDLFLFENPQFERDIGELAEELDFGAGRRDNLLSQIREACEELEGKDLTSGRIVHCRVEKRSKGAGWKLVVRKGKQQPALGAAPSTPAAPLSEFDRAAAEGKPLTDYLEALPLEEQTKIKSSGDEIFRTKYGIGGEITRRLALLEAIRAHQSTSTSTVGDAAPVSEN